MTYKIEQIEGIGPDFGARLAAAGIHTTDDLLTRTLTMDARQRLSMTTGLSVLQLTTWRHRPTRWRWTPRGWPSAATAPAATSPR